LGSAKPYYPSDHPQTYVFEENLKDTTGLFVDETRDTLHTATTGEAANGGLCDTLDVVAKDFAMTLSTTLAKTLKKKRKSHDGSDHIALCRKKLLYLSTFSAARHVLRD
jgi:hypothetical protein